MTPILLTVYPDECDVFGHLNQASFLSLFERARWETLRAGPGMGLFDRTGTWPAVRKTTIEYHASAFPGDVLRFDQDLTHLGRTSFTMRQVARRTRDDALIATAEFLFVCVNRKGRPVAVPREFNEFMAARRRAAGEVQRRTVNGVSLAVEVRGEGPAVLFVHGYPLDRSIWAHQMAALEGWCRIAPDLRGMGQSDAPDLGYSMETYAADLAALLDMLGVDDVVLVGLSMGGYVAFEFLRRWRGRVRGLVLVDTRAEADTADAKRSRDAVAATAREDGAEAIAEAMLPKVLGASTLAGSPATVERVRAMMAATPVAGIVGALAAMRDRPDSSAMLPGLAGLPTLVIVGDEDGLTPPARARSMTDAIPGANLVVIRSSGHLPTLERPVETTDAIQAFLGGLP
ncbi:MAG: alpha/beta fold hydrolase [Gemmatimonadales bacterium]|nr:alpha/beta fold hydrolase [Gemmatimonadales bacterium]